MEHFEIISTANNKKKFFIHEILKFYQIERRDFVWRNNVSIWEMLITEIVLQKTNAGKVANFITKVLSKLKTPENTLKIPIEELENLLKPFGMYKVKAARIKKLADVILKNYSGHIPCSEKELLSLPGVGRYISDAVLCFSCGKDKAVVDVNAIRVVTRYFGIKSPYSRPRNDPDLYKFIQSLVPKGKCREFNWGLIDFSAKVCKLNPICSICNLKNMCMYYNKIL
ncbi:endonuclease III domain-containing protein [Persephonella sp.]